MIFAIPRFKFLLLRGKWRVEAQKDPDAIIVDPGNEIVCDVCNGTIEDEIIQPNDWGVYCNDCLKDRRLK